MKYEHGVGILWGIPTLFRPISLQWALAFKALNPPINFNVNYAIIPDQRVDHARNKICKQALETNAKYIFFTDDDTVPPSFALRQLIFRMEHDPKLGVVGGIYFTKSNPSSPLVFRGNGIGSYWDWKVGEYFEVTGIGMGCTLIRTELLKSIPEPWFNTVDTDSFLDGENKAEQWTEDLWFCKQVLEHTKYKIFADASIICEHHDAVARKSWSVPPNSLPTRQLTCTKDKKKIVDIGCGELVRQELVDEGELVRVDIRDEVDPDYRCDVRQLPFENGEFDVVFSSHVLEHFPRNEYLSTLKEWVRVLKENGELRLILPNVKWAAEQIMQNKMDSDVLNVLYGAQTNPFDFHYNGLTPERMEQDLKSVDVEVKNIEHIGYNMLIRGIKNGKSEILS